MFRISAFADEISPDPVEQLKLLGQCGVKHLELRSIHKTNVLKLTETQVQDFKELLDKRRVTLSAIGSPIGKTNIEEPFDETLERLERAISLCQLFGTPNLRIFSFYKPPETDWETWRDEIMQRLRVMAEIAALADVRLLHENEHNIYGDSPERVVDLLETVNLPSFRAVYDPANYVFCGYDPWEGWQRTKPWTTHFHIKDWKTGGEHGVIAGTGEGRIPEVIAEAVAAGYDGFATLEPHLLGGGPTGGVTGPDLFPSAVQGFTAILRAARAKYA